MLVVFLALSSHKPSAEPSEGRQPNKAHWGLLGDIRDYRALLGRIGKTAPLP